MLLLGPCSPIMKEENMGLPNPYTLAETLEKLRYVLTETRRTDSFELLDKAVNKSREDDALCEATGNSAASWINSGVLGSVLGVWITTPHQERLSPYPYKDAVNDRLCMLAVKPSPKVRRLGAMQESIDFVKLMR